MALHNCASCQTTLPTDAAFCNKCGADQQPIKVRKNDSSSAAKAAGTPPGLGQKNEEVTMSGMRNMMAEYTTTIKGEIANAVGSLSEDFKEELRAVREETKAECSKIREEAKITTNDLKGDLQKMDQRLKKLEDGDGTREGKDGTDRDLQVIVTAWATEQDEKDIVDTISKFIKENDFQKKVKDIFCPTDPCKFGIIEFVSAKAARAFLKKLTKATGKQVGEREMRFSPNLTVVQRAQDKMPCLCRGNRDVQ